MDQMLFSGENAYGQIENQLREKKYKKMLMVCGKSFFSQTASVFFSGLKERLGLEIVYFSDFKPNPEYESICRGTEVFLREKCDLIAACGGGSAMDVAKCIRLFSELDQGRDYLDQTLRPGTVDFMAIPTTAGTGSEATHFAVIYRDGVKISVAENDNMPGYVLFDPKLLASLPDYQKKATLLDAFCHAVESAWSKKSTEESRSLSGRAIRIILENMEIYLSGLPKNSSQWTAAAEEMLEASNLAGRAINITTTTAGHAMSYSMTKLFGIAHGHAAALCVRSIWKSLLEAGWQATDLNGLRLDDEMCQTFWRIVDKMKLKIPEMSEEELELLCGSVNAQRLQNHPVELADEDIKKLYRSILIAV